MSAPYGRTGHYTHLWAQDSSFQAGLSLTFLLRTIEETELNSTELDKQVM